MQTKIKIIILLAVTLNSCALIRKTGEPVLGYSPEYEKSDFITAIKSQNISGVSFYIQKADIFYSMENKSDRFLATIRFKKPDSLLISVRSKTGIEGARIFMTGDTVLINDRINRNLLYGKPADLRFKYGFEPGLLFLFLGDLLLDDNTPDSITECNNGLALTDVFVKGKKVIYNIDCALMKVREVIFSSASGSGETSIRFSRFSGIRDFNYPSVIEIENDNSKEKIRINILKADTYWNGELKFNPAVGYNPVHLK